MLSRRHLSLALSFAFSLMLGTGNTWALGNLDDCGTLRLIGNGCLVFTPDHHPGNYSLDNYAGFGPGERVHVSGLHDSNVFCGCQSRCILQNTISQGCSTLCSAVANDANDDGRMNLVDIVILVNIIFFGGNALSCPEQGDCNGNGRMDIGDVTCMIAIIFNS